MGSRIKGKRHKDIEKGTYGFNAEDVPHDVWWAWVMIQQRMMGKEAHDRVQEIMKKHPEYFKETKQETLRTTAN